MVPSMGRLGIGPGEGNLPMLKQWNSHVGVDHQHSFVRYVLWASAHDMYGP